MSDQLQQALADAINSASDKAGDAVDTILQHAPELALEIAAYGVLMFWVFIALGLALMILPALVWVLVIRMSTGSSGYISSDVLFFGGFLSFAGFVSGCIVIGDGAFDHIMALVAPKIYVIQFATEMFK